MKPKKPKHVRRFTPRSPSLRLGVRRRAPRCGHLIVAVVSASALLTPVPAAATGFDAPIGLGARSSLLSWLLLACLVVLLQIGLLALRNRVRRRIHGPTPTASPPIRPADVIDLRDGQLSTRHEPADETWRSEATDVLERIIREELAAVFDDPLHHDDTLGDDECRELLLHLAASTAARVAARTELDDAARRVLDQELADAVLSAFHLETGDR